MAQKVKNPTATAQVATEVWVQSLAQHSVLKDLALLQLQHMCSHLKKKIISVYCLLSSRYFMVSGLTFKSLIHF